MTEKAKTDEKPPARFDAGPVDGTEAQRAEAKKRAEECTEAVKEALAKHHCRIVPFLLPAEPVGTDGSRALIAASYGIAPDPLP